jgi:hypothetical protein
MLLFRSVDDRGNPLRDSEHRVAGLSQNDHRIVLQMGVLGANPDQEEAVCQPPTRVPGASWWSDPLSPAPSTSLAGFLCPQPIGDPVSSASGDVHLHHAGGSSFDVRGPSDGALLNMLQVSNLSVNVRFTFANFTLGPEDPRAADVREVRGSHLTAVFMVARAGGTLVKIEYDGAARPHTARVVATTDGHAESQVDLAVTSATGPLTFGNLTILMRTAQPVELVVSNTDWRVTAKPAVFRAAADGARKTRVDLAVAALADPLEAPVAPHGLLGQGFDGLRIEGKKDGYVPDESGVFVTKAQGEGAIEGSVGDYQMKEPYATDFTFGRFDKAQAAPRDTAKLNAPIGARNPMLRANATARF